MKAIASRPSDRYEGSFPKENFLRYVAQSKANLIDPPSLEEALRILEPPKVVKKPPFGWLRRRFARPAGE